MIKIKNLTKVFETVNYNIIAVSDANFQFDKGEVVTLLGRSGSGKSTLLNIIGGFDRSYAGSYYLDEIDMKEKTEREIDTIRKRKIGFVFQHYVLLNNLTVLENIEIALKVIGVVNKGSRKRASLHALKLVGLRDHANKYPYQLSGGQRQRVAIARAFVKNPDIMIADEPTAALDSRTSKEILDLLVNLCRNKLLIIATHNKTIVRDYGTRVVELKSGYTIKNELILPDKSNVVVDELDQIIDKELKREDEVFDKLIDIENKTIDTQKTNILKDMGIDVDNFKENAKNAFEIDEELKYRLIKERQKNQKLNTRIHRFLQTSDDFIGKRGYAFKSFLRNISLHLFSSFIFIIFLLTCIFGLNFIQETFSGFNEKARFSREIHNANYVYFPSEEFVFSDNDLNLYEDLNEIFVSDFNQTEIQSNDFFDELMLDPYFRYQYEQDVMNFLKNKLNTLSLDNRYATYYNNSSIIQKEINQNIVFEDFVYKYDNIIESLEPFTYITNFMNVDLDENLYYQFSYIFSENNEDVISRHLVTGSSLPKDDTEVVVPISYLFDYEILDPFIFKDKDGKKKEIITSKEIFDVFSNLPNSDKIITVTTSEIVVTDDGDDYKYEIITKDNNFKIVGLLNLDGDINPFLEMREDVFIQNNAYSNFSFVFSKKAQDKIMFTIENNGENVSLEKSIQYIEINKDVFEKYEIERLLSEFREEYRNNVKNNLIVKFNEWINVLNTATLELYNFVYDDIYNNGEYDPSFLNQLVDDNMFSDLTYGDILNTYLAQHMSVISDKEEFRYLCSICSFSDRDFEKVLPYSDTIYSKMVTSSLYNDALLDLNDITKLTYQETSNRIIYSYYGDKFNNQFYETSNNNIYDFNLVSSFGKETGSILSLVYLVIPREFLSFLPFADSILNSISSLEENEAFINFLESTNLDLLISSVSTNAIRSLIIVLLYFIIYGILIFSMIFLSLTLISLYGNVYEAATNKRTKELASLRILGTSYEDIKNMIKIENRLVGVLSYIAFIIIIVFLANLEILSKEPISHYYMPLLGLFFDFNLYNVFENQIFAIIIVSIIFYFFIYKFIIKRVSLKKVCNIDTIQAIKDGDTYDGN